MLTTNAPARALLDAWAGALRQLRGAGAALRALERAAAALPAGRRPTPSAGCTPGEVAELAGHLAWQAEEAHDLLAEGAPLAVTETADPARGDDDIARALRLLAERELAEAGRPGE
jgi:hypothetical protein